MNIKRAKQEIKDAVQAYLRSRQQSHILIIPPVSYFQNPVVPLSFSLP